MTVVMECYEDMFKEITRKLYGEEEIDGEMGEYENLSSIVPATLGESNGGEQLEEDKWVSSEEEIPWTQSKIASYNSAQKLFRCNECECVGYLSRVAEHWLGTHANLRVFQCPQCPYASAWARCVRMHLARQHNITPEQNMDSMTTFWKENPVLEEVTKFLQRLKSKVENQPSSEQPEVEVKSEEPVPQEISILQAPFRIISTVETHNSGKKRYSCNYCPYATDRRDLFTRHENIHRDEKPFHCYICMKQFNRADHVKKHFVRMHRDLSYDISRIKRELGKEPHSYLPPPDKIETALIKAEINVPGFRHSAIRIEKQPKRKPGEKKYSCCYCSWTGVDNWCLKRHLNTHLKPYICSLCEYKAARSERLATHVFKVHNKRACLKCSFLAEDQSQLVSHQQQVHQAYNRGINNGGRVRMLSGINDPIICWIDMVSGHLPICQ